MLHCPASNQTLWEQSARGKGTVRIRDWWGRAPQMPASFTPAVPFCETREVSLSAWRHPCLGGGGQLRRGPCPKIGEHQLVARTLCDPYHATYVVKGAPSHARIDGWTPSGQTHITIKPVDRSLSSTFSSNAPFCLRPSRRTRPIYRCQGTKHPPRSARCHIPAPFCCQPVALRWVFRVEAAGRSVVGAGPGSG